MTRLHPATRLLSAALLATTAAPSAFASDFTVTLRGRVNTLTAPLPAPFSSAAAGDDVLLSFSIVDQPTPTPGQVTYPVNFSESTLTIGGTVQQYLDPQPPGVLTILDDLPFGVDRMVVSGFAWAGALSIVRVDDPTSSHFNSLDLAELLDLDMGPLDPNISFVTLVAAPAIANIHLEEVRIGDRANASPTAVGDGSGAACPCGNEGGLGQGCANSTGAGAVLSAFGSTSLGDDDLGFWADHLPASTSAILFSGTAGANGVLGVPFGAGLRSPDGQLQRLGVQVADGRGRAEWSVGVLGRSAAMVGTTHYVQAWYRDAASPCPGTDYNGTQAFAVTVQP